MRVPVAATRDHHKQPRVCRARRHLRHHRPRYDPQPGERQGTHSRTSDYPNLSCFRSSHGYPDVLPNVHQHSVNYVQKLGELNRSAKFITAAQNRYSANILHVDKIN